MSLILLVCSSFKNMQINNFPWVEYKRHDKVIIISLLASFSRHRQPVFFFFYRSLSDCKFSHFSRILQNIQADFNSNVVCMFSILTLIPSSTNFLSKPLATFSKGTNCNCYHRNIHIPQPYSCLARSMYLSKQKVNSLFKPIILFFVSFSRQR